MEKNSEPRFAFLSDNDPRSILWCEKRGQTYWVINGQWTLRKYKTGWGDNERQANYQIIAEAPSYKDENGRRRDYNDVIWAFQEDRK